ncbi:hypothetical protein ACCQ10_19035 [Xanthomonas sp. NCPPB 1325]|uniref:hypothetical protein n=1 Tax=Xanthomonas sp. NCPPB 1325 TaxID=487529 RepID=UPI0035574C06
MTSSTRSNSPIAALSPWATHAAANDSVGMTVSHIAASPACRCGRTGTRNRDIWCALPDIRSARHVRRLPRWVTRSVLLGAAGLAFALALARVLLH